MKVNRQETERLVTVYIYIGSFSRYYLEDKKIK